MGTVLKTICLLLICGASFGQNLHFIGLIITPDYTQPHPPTICYVGTLDTTKHVALRASFCISPADSSVSIDYNLFTDTAQVRANTPINRAILNLPNFQYVYKLPSTTLSVAAWLNAWAAWIQGQGYNTQVLTKF